jgi:hypothetical protein
VSSSNSHIPWIVAEARTSHAIGTMRHPEGHRGGQRVYACVTGVRLPRAGLQLTEGIRRVRVGGSTS